MAFLEHIQELYSQELYDEMVFLDELIPENHRGLTSVKNELTVKLYLADAYGKLGKIHVSVKQALLEYKKSSRGNTVNTFSEAEVRFRLHKILLKSRRYDEAIKVLQAVPESEAPAKVKMALAKLIIARDGNKSSSLYLPLFEALVKLCPAALMSTALLIRENKLTAETASIPKSLRSIPTVKTYLYIQNLVAQNLLSEAADKLEASNELSYRILADTGLYMYHAGRYLSARGAFLKAHSLMSIGTEFMDILAFILHEIGDKKSLENLCNELMNENPESPEALIAYGYQARGLGAVHSSKALHLAQSAYILNYCGRRPSIQALTLKSYLLIDTERFEDALKLMREGTKYYPNDYEIHKLLITYYIQKANPRDARLVATKFATSNPSDRRASILKAYVMLKGNSSPKADIVRLLEKTVEEAPYLLEAVWMLVELYDKSHKYEKGRALLERLMRFSHDVEMVAKMHHKLGDFLQKALQPGAAYDHVNKALTNGREEASAEIPNLDALYQTPSPLATRSVLPPAPRRNRPTRQTSDMDTSAEISAADSSQ